MRHGECMWDVIVVSVFVRWTYLPLLVDHREASECCFDVVMFFCVGQNERYVPIIICSHYRDYPTGVLKYLSTGMTYNVFIPEMISISFVLPNEFV